LVTTELDYTLKIWDAATGKRISTMLVITSIAAMPASEVDIFPNSVDWSPTPERLVYGAEDGTIRIWDRNELHAAEVAMEWGDEGVYGGHESPIFAVDWNPTQPLIASSSADHTVRIWDADTGEVIQIIQTSSDVGTVAWSPDGDTLVYGLEDGTLERLAFPRR